MKGFFFYDYTIIIYVLYVKAKDPETSSIPLDMRVSINLHPFVCVIVIAISGYRFSNLKFFPRNRIMGIVDAFNFRLATIIDNYILGFQYFVV